MAKKKETADRHRRHFYIPFEVRHQGTDKAHFSEEELLAEEQNFIRAYSTRNIAPMKLLWRLYRGHYRQLLLSGIFFFIKRSPALFLPIVTERVIDIATCGDPAAYPQIFWWLLGEVLLVAMNVPMHYLHVHFLSLANRSVEAGLRGAMVRKLQQLSISFHKEMESGRIQSKIMRDVEAIEGLSSQVFTSILDIVMSMTVAIVAVASTNLTVLAFFLACVPLSATIAFLFSKSMRLRNREFREEVERTSATVIEMEELVPVSRAHALENKEIRRITEQLNQVAEKGYRLDVLQNVFTAASWATFQVFQLLCLAVTSYMALNGMIAVGLIVMYQSYFTTMVAQVSALLNLLPTLTRGTESIRSAGDILATSDVEDNSGKEKVRDVQGAYEFRDVSFRYDEKSRVLNHFNLSVKAGETVALVGESGAGKSTVLNLLIGFNLPTSGQVLLDGRDITTLDLHSYRRHLALVPQNCILFSGTIRDNITYGLKNVTDDQLWDAIEAAHLTDLIRSLPDGLNTLVGEHGSKLSGGQRQRIAIARAIIRDPRVIVFDEATSALDTVTEKEIQHAIDNLTRDRTTFIVAHRLSTIREADKIAVLAGGHCVEFGTYEELMAKQGEFYRMKQMQS